MNDETGAVRTAHPGRALLSAAVSGAAAAAMAAMARALWPSALDGHGADGLIAWVLVTAALLGTMLCLYLMVIWSLAAVALLAGPASWTGAAVLAALRILAPQVARRVVVGTVLATTATGLALVPAGASTSDSATHPDPVGPAVTVSSELRPALPTETDAEPDAASATTEADAEETALPGLGWGEEPAIAVPSDEAAPAEGAAGPDLPDAVPVDQGETTAAAAEQGARGGADSPQAESIVVVRPGDTLWSITDDLLGPAPDDPSEIAAAWPLLHEANRDVIGADPDRLDPGQELSVPAPLTSQESS